MLSPTLLVEQYVRILKPLGEMSRIDERRELLSSSFISKHFTNLSYNVTPYTTTPTLSSNTVRLGVLCCTYFQIHNTSSSSFS